jgi:hypothetical protein
MPISASFLGGSFAIPPGLNLKSLKNQISGLGKKSRKGKIPTGSELEPVGIKTEEGFLPGLKRKNYSDKKTLLLIPMSTNID